MLLARARVIWERGAEPDRGEDEKNPLEGAKWIWHSEGNPAVSAPVGKRYFRRSLILEGKASVQSARVVMTADNSFQLWVNGRQAGSGDNFHVASSLDIASMLKPGTNVLAVAAVNSGETPNPAGLLGVVVIKFADGHEVTVPTDGAWHSAETAKGKWMTDPSAAGTWTAAMELGPMGMAPWGMIEQPVPQPDDYCDFGIVSDLLGKMGVPPDFESDGPVRYIHRRAADADIYFVANREERAVDVRCVFRITGKAPELWDPVTGETRDLAEFSVKDGRTTVPMRFEAVQSFFVVFRKGTATTTGTGRNFPARMRLTELSGSWEVSFDAKWGGPEKVTFQTLEDWSRRSEEGIRYYSGTATYSKRFSAPPALVGQPMCLDLGVVKNLARVRLNGRDLGVVWCAPWRVEITGALKAGENQLEIAVVNLWPNRLIGDQASAAGEAANLDDVESVHEEHAVAGVRPAGAGDAWVRAQDSATLNGDCRQTFDGHARWIPKAPQNVAGSATVVGD